MSLYGDDLYGAGVYDDDVIGEDGYGFGDYGDGGYGSGTTIDPYMYGYGGYGDYVYDDHASTTVVDSIKVTSTTSVCNIGLKSVTGNAKILLTAVRVPQAANPIVQSSPTILSPIISSK